MRFNTSSTNFIALQPPKISVQSWKSARRRTPRSRALRLDERSRLALLAGRTVPSRFPSRIQSSWTNGASRCLQDERRSSTDAESERGERFGLEPGMCENHCGVSTAAFLVITRMPRKSSGNASTRLRTRFSVSRLAAIREC